MKDLVRCFLPAVIGHFETERGCLLCLSDVDQIVLSESVEGELGVIHLLHGSPPLLFYCLVSLVSLSDGSDTAVAQMEEA